VILLALVAILLAASPAVAAHPPNAHDAFSHGPLEADTAPSASPADAALLCLGALTLPFLLVASHRRRAVAVVTAVLLVGLAGETALHSAHHLADPAGAERCLAFSASQHLAAPDLDGGAPVVDRPPPTARPMVVPVACPVAVVPAALRARAPPVPPA
jgi:hypothetical protein